MPYTGGSRPARFIQCKGLPGQDPSNQKREIGATFSWRFCFQFSECAVNDVDAPVFTDHAPGRETGISEFVS